MLELTTPEHAYILGFFQTDGHLRKHSRNRGQLSLEISSRDEDILHRIRNILPVNSFLTRRVRNTNFAEKSSFSKLAIYDLNFRTEINNLGLPYGKKSTIIAPPSARFSEPDYIRGLVDGDGTLGISATGRPFIGLTTASEAIAIFYQEFVRRISNRPCSSKRNARDNIYNIISSTETAQQICAFLYYDGCLALDRKLKAAEQIASWNRPPDVKRKPPSKRWRQSEDDFIRTHSIQESVASLGRSKKSISIRLLRLKGANY